MQVEPYFVPLPPVNAFDGTKLGGGRDGVGGASPDPVGVFANVRRLTQAEFRSTGVLRWGEFRMGPM